MTHHNFSKKVGMESCLKIPCVKILCVQPQITSPLYTAI